MKETIYRLNTKLALFFSEKINIVIFLLCLNFLFILYIYLESCDERYHYYMNTKTTLEEISGKKFDSYNGKIMKELSTEEYLVRKQNRRFHLKYLFK